jgi:hypothetical protein
MAPDQPPGLKPGSENARRSNAENGFLHFLNYQQIKL